MIRPYVVGADRKARGGGERVGGRKGGGDWVVSWQSGSEFFSLVYVSAKCFLFTAEFFTRFSTVYFFKKTIYIHPYF